VNTLIQGLKIIIRTTVVVFISVEGKSPRGINIDHGINVDQHSKLRANSLYCICTCFAVLSVELHLILGEYLPKIMVYTVKTFD
jgi:hypothetical protein